MHPFVLFSLCVGVNCPVSFLVSYSYPYLMQWAGGQGTFWLYSAISLLGGYTTLTPTQKTQDAENAYRYLK